MENNSECQNKRYKRMELLGQKLSVLENWPSFWRGNDAISTTGPQELLGCRPSGDQWDFVTMLIRVESNYIQIPSLISKSLFKNIPCMHFIEMLHNDYFVMKFQDKQMWVVVSLWCLQRRDPGEKLVCILASQLMPRQNRRFVYKANSKYSR